MNPDPAKRPTATQVLAMPEVAKRAKQREKLKDDEPILFPIPDDMFGVDWDSISIAANPTQPVRVARSLFTDD
jgi:hypothetical protein